MLNKVLNKYCHEENISVINHNYINSTRHLNRRKLHFNNYGNSVFVKNIINFLSNLIWRDSRDNSGYKQNSPSLSISTLNSLDISESSNIYENDLHKIKVQCLEHFNTLIVGHLNISSIRNKFQMVAETANVKIICIEFHQLKPKWYLLGCYKPTTQSDLEFIASVTKNVDFYLQKFENLFITGDLNTENTHLNDLLQIYDLTALIQEPTCYQSFP